MRRMAGAVIVLCLGLVISGCSSDAESTSANGGDDGNTASEVRSLGRFVLSNSGCRYEGPESASAGEVSLTLASEVDGPVQFDLWRMNEDHAYAELVAHVEEEQRLLDAGEPPMGHPAIATEVFSQPLIESRGETTVTFAASAGEYGMTCVRLERSFAAAGPFVLH